MTAQLLAQAERASQAEIQAELKSNQLADEQALPVSLQELRKARLAHQVSHTASAPIA